MPGHVLGRLGAVNRDLHDYSESVRCYEAAIPLMERWAEKAPDAFLPELAMTLSNYGNTLSDLKRFPDAREKYESALAIRRQLIIDHGDSFKASLAKTLRSLGNLHRKSGEYDEARAAYEEVISLMLPATQEGSGSASSVVAAAFLGLSSVALEEGKLEEAYSTCQEAVEMRRSIGDASELAESLQNLSEIENRLDLMELAFEHIEEAVFILERGSQTLPEVYLPPLASALNNQGNLLMRDKRYVEAERAHVRAIAIRRDLANTFGGLHLETLASTICNFGTAKLEMGQLNAAQELLKESLQLYKRSDPNQNDSKNPDLARIFYNLGNAYSQQCQFEAGRNAYTRAMKIQEELVLANPHMFEPKLGKTLCSLGTVLNILGDDEESRCVFERALVVLKRYAGSGLSADLEMVSTTLTNYGNTLSRLGELDLAIERYEQAAQYERRLTSMRPKEFQRGLAAALHNLGVALAERSKDPDDVRRAIEALTEAVSIRMALDANEQTALAGELSSTRCALGKLLAEAGNVEDSIPLLREAAEEYEKLGRLEPDLYVADRIDTFGFLGNVLLDQYLFVGGKEQLWEAHKWLTMAASLGESLRFRYINPLQRRKSSERNHWGILDSVVTACCEIGILNGGSEERFEEAITYGEQGRMRALRDLLDIDLAPSNTPPEVVEKLRRAHKDVMNTSRLLHEADTSAGVSFPPLMPMEGDFNSREKAGLDTRVLKKRFYEACDAYQDALSDIQENYDPLFEAEGQSAALSVADIRAVLPSENAAAIQFSMTDAGLYVLIVYPDAVDGFKLADVTSANLTGVSQEWFAGIQAFREHEDADLWRKDMEKVLAQLSRHIIEPAIGRLRPGVERLVLSPHQELHVFPLGACPVGDSERVGDRYEIWLAPSLSVFHACMKRDYGVRNRAFCLELPEQSLVSHEIEMGRLGYYFDGQVVRHKVTNERVRDMGIGVLSADVWHYSGHCKFDANDPLESYLGERRESPSLTLRDLFSNLRLPQTRLAVLSGCESGSLNPDILDDYVGFPVALLRAGAKCVVSSHWPAEDLPTMLLFDRFYQNWKNGATIACALRNAQFWLRGTPDQFGEALDSGNALMAYVASDAFAAPFSNKDAHERCIQDARYWAEGVDSPPFESPVYWAAFSASGDCGQTWTK